MALRSESAQHVQCLVREFAFFLERRKLIVKVETSKVMVICRKVVELEVETETHGEINEVEKLFR